MTLSIVTTVSHAVITLGVALFTGAVRLVELAADLPSKMLELVVRFCAILDNSRTVIQDLQTEFAALLYLFSNLLLVATMQLARIVSIPRPRSAAVWGEAKRSVLQTSFLGLLCDETAARRQILRMAVTITRPFLCNIARNTSSNRAT
jgi:hypothetical protein